MRICLRVFGKFAYSLTDDAMFFSVVFVYAWCARIVVGNIVMNFCCWFIYYYDDDDDCDSMERPFRNWIEWWRWQQQQRVRVLRKFHQHCLFIVAHSLSSSIGVAVQLLFHSNDFHFIKFHWNIARFSHLLLFLPLPFLHLDVVCVSFAFKLNKRSLSVNVHSLFVIFVHHDNDDDDHDDDVDEFHISSSCYQYYETHSSTTVMWFI